MLKKIVAEVLGTFVLVFAGTTTAVLTGGNVLLTALAFGLALMAMIYTVGSISGGHFNPAVSLAMWIRKKINLAEFGIYVLSQIVGALLATLLLFVFLDAKNTALGGNQVALVFMQKDMGLVVGLLAEVVLTFVLVSTIIGVTKEEENNHIAGIVIGLVLTGLIVVGFQITGGSLNPARSLAPALFEQGKALQQVWLYILGPLVGGALAALLGNFLHSEVA